MKQPMYQYHTEEEEDLSVRQIVFAIFRLVLVAVCAFGITLFLCEHYVINAKVPSSSMVPVLHPENRILGFRKAYAKKPVERFDVLIFRFPDNPDEIYVKRVIGLPGETITVDAEGTWVNGQLLHDPYATNMTKETYGPYVVPDDCYFMMGDNRSGSFDSRFWLEPFVHEDLIMAKAVWVYYPLSDWHLL